MKRKIKSYIKYYSNIIFPILVCITCYFIQHKSGIFLLTDDKASALISIATEFISVLLTILTIYLAVPKNPVKIKQLKESKHQHIYLSNILTGITFAFLSILSWLLWNNALFAVILFMGSISNIIITIYYTFSLIKIMES